MRFRSLLGALLFAFAPACGTVDPGDNIVPPDLALDEDFFYCQIQPNVIRTQTCASGAAGEAGDCHSARSAMRLTPLGESDAPPTCDGDMATGAIPASYVDNYTAVQSSVQADPLSSPFYRRPVGLDSHPRVIFAEDSPEAMLIVQWISAGGT